ncbi:hypothetical protein [Bradyrhizobium lablabi]|uniref:hypothetical protein n=1 Tax=Bradyrhizobium lablabi TaxID=722472 RepID=UPI001BA7A0D2|nr:hypothetical protein [Bradyrhizobium lablabi]MBR0694276.1 hypothetical protein [Bradyrhizobium lablabi]
MIRSVDESHYDIARLSLPFYRDLAWFATDDDAVLGVVVLDLIDHDFGWVALRQNDQGPGYTAVNLGVSLPTIAAATQASIPQWRRRPDNDA